MSRALAVALVCLAGGVAALTGPPGAESARSRALRVHAFYYPMPGALARLRAVGDRIDVLAPEWWQWNSGGERLVRETEDEEAEVQALAHAKGIALWPAVNLSLHRRPFFSTRGRGEALRAQIVALARVGDYEGVTLDLEGVAPLERPAYHEFVGELAQALGADGRGLAVYVPRPEPGFDLARLARTTDLLLVSAYPESWEVPGPITTTPGLERLLGQLAALPVPQGRLAVTLGAFGYLWRHGSQEPDRVIWTRDVIRACPVETLLVDADGAGTCAHPDGRIWFETDAGLRARLDAVRTSGAARWVSLFLLGAEDESFWNALPQRKG